MGALYPRPERRGFTVPLVSFLSSERTTSLDGRWIEASKSFIAYRQSVHRIVGPQFLAEYRCLSRHHSPVKTCTRDRNPCSPSRLVLFLSQPVPLPFSPLHHATAALRKPGRAPRCVDYPDAAKPCTLNLPFVLPRRSVDGRLETGLRV
jgi:hypothetical protein